MQIIDEFPPNIEAIKKVFPINTNTVYTYGDILYAPGIKFALPMDLIEHESIHSLQQRVHGGAEAWWERYLKDPAFRKDQEQQAYKAQYEYLCAHCNSRSKRFQLLVALARDFSSPLYGSIVDFYTACRLIKE